jgi:hypothetical protein
MAKAATLPMLIFLLVATGCGRQVDSYDAAMRRLVAEQKQLDWIDTKIREIDESANKRVDELQKSAEDLAATSATLSPEMGEKGLRTMEAMGGVQEQIFASAGRLKEPWVRKRAEQLKRIEDARRTVDQLGQAN